jgi:hypothetical protein
MVDFSLDNDAVKYNDIDLILQQIDLLFDTTPREVLGHPNYGTRYDDYLYRLNISPMSIKQQIINDLNSLELFHFTPIVDVHLLRGSERDIILIEITLEREYEKYNRIYKIT